mmetsp:Transcript_84294/g.260662  ORF Transcript_84294/g.260662 Transcript_84294/m.260662 type:complete len:208 (+) Transcript_84294:1-624(+)
MQLCHGEAHGPGALVHGDLAAALRLDLADNAAAPSEQPAYEPLLDVQLLVHVGPRPRGCVHEEGADGALAVGVVPAYHGPCQRGVHVLGGLLHRRSLAADLHLAVSLLLGALVNSDADAVGLLDLLERGPASANDPAHEALLHVELRLKQAIFATQVLESLGTLAVRHLVLIKPAEGTIDGRPRPLLHSQILNPPGRPLAPLEAQCP